MNEAPKADMRALLQRSVLTIQRLEKELAEAKRAGSSEPIAIVGIGCRFPGGADTPEKALGSSLQRAGRGDRDPQAPLGHRRDLFARCRRAGQDLCPLGRLSRRRGRLRARLLRHHPARGREYRPSAADVAGNHVGSAGTRRYSACVARRNPDGGLCRHHRARLVDDVRHGARRADRRCLRGVGRGHLHRLRAAVVFPGRQRSELRAGYGVFLVDGGSAPGGDVAQEGRIRFRAGGGRDADPVAGGLDPDRTGTDDVVHRQVPHLRRLRRRLCAGRGLRHDRPETPLGRRTGRRPGGSPSSRAAPSTRTAAAPA